MQVRNDKARRYLTSMRKKQSIPFAQKFPNADPLSLRLLERLLAFDPKDRPTAEEVRYLRSFLKCSINNCFSHIINCSVLSNNSYKIVELCYCSAISSLVQSAVKLRLSQCYSTVA
jgi:serine/threonine protein kinase